MSYKYTKHLIQIAKMRGSQVFLLMSIVALTIQSSAIAWVWPWTEHTVFITNDMSSNQQPLFLHCWSKDDDLGNHTLYKTNNFHFSFREDLRRFHSTFDCEMQHGDQMGHSSVYPDHCSTFQTCFWSIRDDGFYVGHKLDAMSKVGGWT